MAKIKYIPYTAKFSSGKTFVVFTGFLLYRECFTMNRLASNRHSYKEAATAKVFPVNVHFLFQPRKFSHSKVLPYTVCYKRIDFKTKRWYACIQHSGQLLNFWHSL